MTVTVLAIGFLLVVLAIALFGFKAVITQGKAPEDLNKEKCSLCRMQFNKSLLIERQVGDYRVHYFCQGCITKLHEEMVRKN